MDMKSIVDLDANIVNLREADKAVEDNAFILSDAVGKEVGDADKSSWGVRNRVGNRATYSLSRNVQSNKAFASHFPNIIPFYFITNFLFPPIG